MDDDKVKNLSAVFRIPEEIIKGIIDRGENPYDEISKHTGLSRSEVKRWAYAAMYSTKDKGLML